MQGLHVSIARSLGQDRRRGNLGNATVSAYDCARGHGQLRALIAVYQDFRGDERETGHRALHGEQARAQYVQAVYFLHARGCNGPAQAMRTDFACKLFATSGRELLGISKTGDRTKRIERNAGSKHRSGKRPPPGLIHPAHGCRCPAHAPAPSDTPAAAAVRRSSRGRMASTARVAVSCLSSRWIFRKSASRRVRT